MFALLLKTTLDGYIDYGAGDFDGEGSGHDFYGVRPHPKSPCRTHGKCSKEGHRSADNQARIAPTGYAEGGSSGGWRMLRPTEGGAPEIG